MKQQCPLCPRWHQFDELDWVFLCLCGYSLVWVNEGGGPLLVVAPGQFEEE